MAVLATDNFNRANSNPAGGNWSTVPTTLGVAVLSNRIANAKSGIGGQDGAGYWNAVTWPNNQYSQVTMGKFTGGGRDGGPAVRISNSAYTLYYITHWDSSNHIAKIVGGSWTELSSAGTNWALGDTLYIEVQGTTLISKVNGTQDMSTTDSSISSGRAGVLFYESSDFLDFDNFEGGDFAASGVDSDVVARGGTRTQNVSKKTASVSAVGRAGARTSNVRTKAVSRASVTRTGTRSTNAATTTNPRTVVARTGVRSTNVAVRGAVSTSAERVGVRTQSVDLKATTKGTANRVGTRIQAQLTKAAPSTVAHRSGSTTFNVLARVAQVPTTDRVGAVTQNVPTKVTTSTVEARTGARSQGAGVGGEVRTSSSDSRVGIRSTSVVVKVVAQTSSNRTGTRLQVVSSKIATSAVEERSGAQVQVVSVKGGSTDADLRTGALTSNNAIHLEGDATFSLGRTGVRTEGTSVAGHTSAPVVRVGARTQCVASRGAVSAQQVRTGARTQSIAGTAEQQQSISAPVARIGARSSCSSLGVRTTVGTTLLGGARVTLDLTSGRVAAPILVSAGARGRSTVGEFIVEEDPNAIDCTSDADLPDRVVWPEGVERVTAWQGVFGDVEVILQGCEPPAGALKDWEL